MGQVIEFYINFGYMGVVAGFLLLGVALRWMDIQFVAALLRDDWDKTMLWFLVGSGTSASWRFNGRDNVVDGGGSGDRDRGEKRLAQVQARRFTRGDTLSRFSLIGQYGLLFMVGCL